MSKVLFDEDEIQKIMSIFNSYLYIYSIMNCHFTFPVMIYDKKNSLLSDNFFLVRYYATQKLAQSGLSSYIVYLIIKFPCFSSKFTTFVYVNALYESSALICSNE